MLLLLSKLFHRPHTAAFQPHPLVQLFSRSTQRKLRSVRILKEAWKASASCASEQPSASCAAYASCKQRLRHSCLPQPTGTMIHRAKSAIFPSNFQQIHVLSLSVLARVPLRRVVTLDCQPEMKEAHQDLSTWLGLSSKCCVI